MHERQQIEVNEMGTSRQIIKGIRIMEQLQQEIFDDASLCDLQSKLMKNSS